MVTGFISPLGLNRLLRYMETNGEGALVRPWMWIAWLFLGPTMNSLAQEYYLHITGRTLIRAESIITQLIFEHALRIRMKAEADNETHNNRNTAAETLQGPSNLASKDKQKQRSSGKRLKSNNLIGMINNLVTTDLGNITDARDFLYGGTFR